MFEKQKCHNCAKECPWDTITMLAGTEVEALLSEDISKEA